TGEDYRLYVVGDKFVGAIKRIPANIIGGGKNTVNQLINLKNLSRDKNPAIGKSPIKIDKELLNELSKMDYTLDSIPKKGELLYLKSKSNISSGRDPIDATDEIPDRVKNMAVAACNAIPGLVKSGVYVIYDKGTNNAIILEINTLPSIRTHLFTMEGKARDIPSAIIDYYFPETKPNHGQPC